MSKLRYVRNFRRNALSVMLLVNVIFVCTIYFFNSQSVPQSRIPKAETSVENSFMQIISKKETVKMRKYLIYSCQYGTCGGWANRLYGITMTYILALLSNRTFKIIHTQPCDINLFFDPNIIQWKVTESELRNLSSVSIFQIDSRRLKRTMQSLNLTKYFNSDIVYFTINWDFTLDIRKRADTVNIAGFQGLTVGSIYRKVYNSMFQQKADFREELDKYKARQIGHKTSVCAHIRIQDQYSSYQGDENLIWNWFKSFNGSKYVYFLATNRQIIKDKAKSLFNEKFVDIPGAITHIDQSEGPSACVGFKKALMDHAILASCDILLLSSSGFGMTSAYIRGTSDNLFCLVSGTIIPCSVDVLHELFIANLEPERSV